MNLEGPYQRLQVCGELPEKYKEKRIKGANDAADLLSPLIAEYMTESMVMLCLDVKNRVNAIVRLAEGGEDFVVVDIKHAMRTALACNASALIFAHNHPSGDITPSEEDKLVTKRLKSAAETVGLRFLDHIVLTSHGFYSFADVRS